MQLLEVLKTESSINIESQEWQFVLKQLHIQLSVDVDKLDYYRCYPCRFTLKANRNAVKISERNGYFLSAKQGILIVCPSTTDLPVTLFIDKKTIRVVQSESKLLKSEVNVKTNDETFVFRAGKKQCSEIEKEVNKVRLV
ncbi:MAG: hypothetical protein IJ561_04145 [Ruminococcus sp.]|nr:hypothetical protein [Ruminococcus sp.]